MDKGRLSRLEAFRRELHESAETSGNEEKTAGLVLGFLKGHPPDQIVTGLGGHGLAAVFEGKSDGPTILLRADMDALPIPETVGVDGADLEKSVSHRCGHDGHMTTLCGVAQTLTSDRPGRGRVILLFQPAEETGEGAAKVLSDPAFEKLGPIDSAFAFHNLPGYELGRVVVRSGVFAAASSGLLVGLRGTTSHAAEPSHGKSPALAVSDMIQAFSSLPQLPTGLDEAAKVTVVHACVGEPEEFGTSPGKGVVMATLRAYDDDVMKVLSHKCVNLSRGIARTYDLDVDIDWTQEFPPTVNDSAAVDLVERAAAEMGLEIAHRPTPFPWSEDFGHFTGAFGGALFGIGAGESHPDLHNPDYEFPDALIPLGVGIFDRIIDAVLKERDV